MHPLAAQSVTDLVSYALFRAHFLFGDFVLPIALNPYPSQCRSHSYDLRLSRVLGWVPIGSPRASWAYLFDLVVGQSPSAFFAPRVWLSVADLG